MNAKFVVYPAIDVRDGRVVRLMQGDYARETRYADDPLELARLYADAGATWLHLVDLDAARAGGYTLSPLLEKIKMGTGLRVQTGGGIRSESQLKSLFAAGADRIVIGSLAVTDRECVAEWIDRYGCTRLTIALDARCGEDGLWRTATHGWTQQGQYSLRELVGFYGDVGLRHLLCTDIARDGMLSGPNMALYALLSKWAPRMELQASGGARNLADLRAIRDAGCDGIVLGKALLEGRLRLSDALSC